MSQQPKKLQHKCPYCLKIFRNKEYMNHLAEKHNDKRAVEIIEELKNL